MKDFRAMYTAYAKEFAYAPITMTPCEAFTIALEKGRIDEQTYAEARKHFGNLWNYSGE